MIKNYEYNLPIFVDI